jgi:hypothetical protein
MGPGPDNIVLQLPLKLGIWRNDQSLSMNFIKFMQ